MKFKSRIDSWIAVLVWGSVAVCIAPLFFQFDWVLFIVAISLLLLISVMWFGTYYQIEEGVLIVSSGITRNRIEIATINKLTKSTNPLSSPALSMKRIEVLYEGMQIVLISPKEQAYFIQLLHEQNPQMIVEEQLL